jgi:hypothetical protein
MDYTDRILISFIYNNFLSAMNYMINQLGKFRIDLSKFINIDPEHVWSIIDKNSNEEKDLYIVHILIYSNKLSESNANLLISHYFSGYTSCFVTRNKHFIKQALINNL